LAPFVLAVAVEASTFARYVVQQKLEAVVLVRFAHRTRGPVTNENFELSTIIHYCNFFRLPINVLLASIVYKKG